MMLRALEYNLSLIYYMPIEEMHYEGANVLNNLFQCRKQPSFFIFVSDGCFTWTAICNHTIYYFEQITAITIEVPFEVGVFSFGIFSFGVLSFGVLSSGLSKGQASGFELLYPSSDLSLAGESRWFWYQFWTYNITTNIGVL